MKKNIALTTLLSLSLLSATAASANTEIDNTPVPVQKSTEEISVETPNVKYVDGLGVKFGSRALLLSQTIDFNGQGYGYFDYKSNGSSETVRVYVKNTGTKAINYKLIAPSGTSWVSSSLQPGEYITTEHVFAEGQVGQWKIKLNTNDGSAGKADVAVRDGL